MSRSPIEIMIDQAAGYDPVAYQAAKAKDNRIVKATERLLEAVEHWYHDENPKNASKLRSAWESVCEAAK